MSHGYPGGGAYGSGSFSRPRTPDAYGYSHSPHATGLSKSTWGSASLQPYSPQAINTQQNYGYPPGNQQSNAAFPLSPPNYAHSGRNTPPLGGTNNAWSRYGRSQSPSTYGGFSGRRTPVHGSSSPLRSRTPVQDPNDGSVIATIYSNDSGSSRPWGHAPSGRSTTPNQHTHAPVYAPQDYFAGQAPSGWGLQQSPSSGATFSGRRSPFNPYRRNSAHWGHGNVVPGWGLTSGGASDALPMHLNQQLNPNTSSGDVPHVPEQHGRANNVLYGPSGGYSYGSGHVQEQAGYSISGGPSNATNTTYTNPYVQASQGYPNNAGGVLPSQSNFHLPQSDTYDTSQNDQGPVTLDYDANPDYYHMYDPKLKKMFRVYKAQTKKKIEVVKDSDEWKATVSYIKQGSKAAGKGLLVTLKALGLLAEILGPLGSI